jgi:transposase-like protein
MPWKQTRALDLQKSLIKAWERDEYSLAELCRQNGISRQTAYKWLQRYEEEGNGSSPAALSTRVGKKRAANRLASGEHAAPISEASASICRSRRARLAPTASLMANS